MHGQAGCTSNASGLTTVFTSLRSFINVAFQELFPSNLQTTLITVLERMIIAKATLLMLEAKLCHIVHLARDFGSFPGQVVGSDRQIGYVSASGDATIVQEGNSN